MLAKSQRKAEDHELDRDTLDLGHVRGMLGILSYRSNPAKCKHQKMIDEAKHALEVFVCISYSHFEYILHTDSMYRRLLSYMTTPSYHIT